MFEGIPLVALGPFGTLVFVAALPYIQIARSRLVPYSFLERERKQAEIAVERERQNTAEYKAAWEKSEAARLTQTAQQTELLEHARTADAMIRALTEHVTRAAP